MTSSRLTDHAHRPLGTSRRPASRRASSLLTLLLLLVSFTLPLTPAVGQTVGTTLLDPDFEMAFAGVAAAAPGHGTVAAWGRGVTDTVAGGAVILAPDRVMAVWLGPDGLPLTPIRALDQPDDDIEVPLAVASAAPGDAVVALGTTSGLQTRRFRFDGGALPPLQPVTSCEERAGVTQLVAAGDGYWLVWHEPCAGGKLLARRLGLSGAPEGEAVEIAEPGNRLRLRFGAAATPDGGFWVAWDQLTPAAESSGRAIVARRYGPDGAPATDAVELRKFFPERAETSTDLAALPAGGALVSWRDRTERIFLRRVGADGVPAGPPIQASDAPAVRELRPQVATSGLGVSAATWTRVPPGSDSVQCVLRLFDTVRPESGDEVEIDSACSGIDELVFRADGSLFLLTHESVPLPHGAFVTLDYARPRIAVLPAAETVRPPGPGFVSQAVPGFRIWVRIGGDEPAPRLGRPEAACLPETACVSGSIPGRSEVFVRMVGPKPNGYLWPTIVRFTTSTVEVWIEQTSTGTLRYYRLDGATPGASDLTGRFDRMGFMP